MFHPFTPGVLATCKRPMRRILNLRMGEYASIAMHPDESTYVVAYTHFDVPRDERVLCRGDRCPCLGMGEAWPRERRVFTPVQYMVPALCGDSALQPSEAIPAYAVFAWTENIQHVFASAKECCWFVRRRGKKKNGPLSATAQLWRFMLNRWPDELCVKETIERIYGIGTLADRANDAA